TATQVACYADLGCRRGDEALLTGDVSEVAAEKGRTERVADQAGYFDLVHGEDHRGRCAEPPERLANLRDLGNRRACPAELSRDERAEHAVLPQGRDRFTRKASLTIDGGRRRPGDIRPAAPRRFYQVAGDEKLTHPAPPSSSSRHERIAAMVANVRRCNIRSGNSI